MPEIYLLCLSVKKKLKSFLQNISPILENPDQLGGQQVAFSATKWRSGQMRKSEKIWARLELYQKKMENLGNDLKKFKY